MGFEPDFGIWSRFRDFSLILGFSGIGPRFDLSPNVGLMLLLRWLLGLSRVLFELEFKIMDATGWLVVLVRVFCASYSCLLDLSLILGFDPVWGGFQPDFGIRSRFGDLSLILGFSGIGLRFDLSPSMWSMLLLSCLSVRVWFGVAPDFRLLYCMFPGIKSGSGWRPISGLVFDLWVVRCSGSLF